MARHCVREPRYIPPVHVIGEQPDLFGGPTISHATERKPISNKWMSDMTKWAVSPWLGDMDPESALEPETVLETAPAPLPVYLVACVAAKLDHAAEARDLYASPWFRKARAHVERTGAPWLLPPQPMGSCRKTLHVWMRCVGGTLRKTFSRVQVPLRKIFDAHARLRWAYRF